jgi:signal transduction histidine kinase
MRSPPAHDLNGGADERLSPRRPATEPAAGGEALVEYLVDRLASVERELGAARAIATDATADRALLARVARHVAEHDAAPLDQLLRLTLPLLGDWCIVECCDGEAVKRLIVATESVRETMAAPLAGAVHLGYAGSITLARARASGRIERLEVLPDLPHLDEPATRALHALGDGPMLVVPVNSRGCLVAALGFGRASAGPPYGADAQQLAAELAGFVALAVEQYRAEAVADEAARAKAEFLTMMSHELRTPLNAIAGYAQLLEMGFRGPLTEPQRDAVARILRGPEHLLELVDAVLTFSRLTSGKLALDTTALSAAGVLQVASEPLVGEFAERGITLLVSPCSEDIRVFADRERAPEILRHLLGNALKFTAPGGRVVAECLCDGDCVRFVVSDSGRGIPPDQLEAIFQPFVQAEKGTPAPSMAADWGWRSGASSRSACAAPSMSRASRELAPGSCSRCAAPRYRRRRSLTPSAARANIRGCTPGMRSERTPDGSSAPDECSIIPPGRRTLQGRAY